MQPIGHHLAPAGVAGFVLSDGSMSSDQSFEGEVLTMLLGFGTAKVPTQENG